MESKAFASEDRFVVVVGVDWSTSSIAAFSVACTLAQARSSAIVHALHVVRIEPHLRLDGAVDVDFLEERRKLDELCGAPQPPARLFRHVVLDRPEIAIVELARQQGADLVVIGTRRRSGLERLLLGSLTDHVVHSSPCPVLVVPDDTGGPAPTRSADATQMRHAP